MGSEEVFYGKQFTLITDYRLLEIMLNPQKSVPRVPQWLAEEVCVLCRAEALAAMAWVLIQPKARLLHVLSPSLTPLFMSYLHCPIQKKHQIAKKENKIFKRKCSDHGSRLSPTI